MELPKLGFAFWNVLSDIVMIWRLPVFPCPKSSFISLPPSHIHAGRYIHTHTYAHVCIHTWMCAHTHTHTHTHRATFLFCQWLTVSVAVSSSLSAHTHAHNIYPVLLHSTFFHWISCIIPRKFEQLPYSRFAQTLINKLPWLFQDSSCSKIPLWPIQNTTFWGVDQ